MTALRLRQVCRIMAIFWQWLSKMQLPDLKLCRDTMFQEDSGGTLMVCLSNMKSKKKSDQEERKISKKWALTNLTWSVEKLSSATPKNGSGRLIGWAAGQTKKILTPLKTRIIWNQFGGFLKISGIKA